MPIQALNLCMLQLSKQHVLNRKLDVIFNLTTLQVPSLQFFNAAIIYTAAKRRDVIMLTITIAFFNALSIQLHLFHAFYREAEFFRKADLF